MKNYSSEEVDSLIKRFEAEQLPKMEWTHEAHLVVAIWYCFHFGFEKALPIVRKNITNHNASVGTPNTDTEGYHESISKFWLIVATNFLTNEPNSSVDELCNRFINSEVAHSHYPLEFYSKEVLFSVDARKNWVEPDLNTLELKNTIPDQHPPQPE